MKITKAFLSNKTLTTVAALLVAIYGALAAPALPNQVILFFDTWYGKILFMFLIAFVASHNFQVALMIAVLFFIILQLATRLDIENFKKYEKFSEYFEDVKTNMVTMLSDAICSMVKDKPDSEKKKRVREYARENAKVLIEKLKVSEEDYYKTVDNLEMSQTVEDLCKEHSLNNKKDTSVTSSDTTKSTGTTKQDMTETFENATEYFENGFSAVPVDYSEMDAGAPVDF
jgi:membrane protein CcdC involved in cytochrome C biogenesis